MSASGIIITQNNGSQGRTTIGPKTVDSRAPTGTADNMVVREVELQLDGNVFTEHTTANFDDDTQFAFPAHSLVLDVVVAGIAGVTALNVGLEDNQGNSVPTALLAAQAVGENGWAVVPNLNLVLDDHSQLIFDGLLPDESATVLIRYIAPRARQMVDGVLTVHN